MLDTTTRGTYIYFHTPENKGLTRGTLRAIYKLAQRNSCDLEYDGEEAKYLLRAYGTVWTTARIRDVAKELRFICGSISLTFNAFVLFGDKQERQYIMTV